MTRKDKLLEKLMAGRSDANFAFDDLVLALRAVGFELDRVRGSHRSFRSEEHPAECPNLQPGADGKAKPYQVKQVRELLKKLKKA